MNELSSKNIFENKVFSNYDRFYIAVNRAAVLSFQGEVNLKDFQRKQSWLLSHVMTSPPYLWATAEGMGEIVETMRTDDLIRQIIFSVTTRVFAELSLEGYNYPEIVKVIFNCMPTCGEEKNNVLPEELSSRFLTARDFIEFYMPNESSDRHLDSAGVNTGDVLLNMPDGLSGGNRWLLSFPLLSIFGSIDSIRAVKFLGEAI